MLRCHEVRERQANIELARLNAIETCEWIFAQFEDLAYNVDPTDLSNKWTDKGGVLKQATGLALCLKFGYRDGTTLFIEIENDWRFWRRASVVWSLADWQVLTFLGFM